MMLLYGAGARASYRNISCTIGTPFWLDWDQEGPKTRGKPSMMTLDMVLSAGRPCSSPRMHFFCKSAASSSHVSRIGQASKPQQCWTYGQNAPKNHATRTFYRVWPGQCTPNLSHACPVGTGSLETWQKMMLAKGASIISIIGGPFLHYWPPMRPMTPH